MKYQIIIIIVIIIKRLPWKKSVSTLPGDTSRVPSHSREKLLFSRNQRCIRRIQLPCSEAKRKALWPKYTVQNMKHPADNLERHVGAWDFQTLPFPPYTMHYGLRYVELLQEKLQQHIEIRKSTFVMQDGEPCRRSKVATEFVHQNRVQGRE